MRGRRGCPGLVGTMACTAVLMAAGVLTDDVFTDGVFTDDEFTAAKAKLLA